MSICPILTISMCFPKRKAVISDEEYRKQIVAQAYKDFEKGTFQNKSDGLTN